MNKKPDLKVLHLIPRFRRGGAERVICSLALHLNPNQKGVLATSGGNWTSYLHEVNLEWCRVPLYPSNPFNALRSFIALRQIVRQEQIELIHSHHRFSSLLGRAVAQSLSLPFVCTVHDLAKGNRLITRLALGENVTVFSQAVTTHLIEHFGLKREQISRIPMGIASAHLSSSAEIQKIKDQMGESPQTPIVGFVGRLVDEKGPDLFLQAVPQVSSQFPNVKFLVVGDGELRAQLEMMAQRLELENKVRFLGGRDDVYSLLPCFDLMVVPSRREGFGLAALEALIHGTPVIATRVGGLPELVQHEKNGLLVPPNEVNAIASAMIQLLDNQALACRLGRQAYDMAQEEFNLEAMLREIRVLYQSVLAKHKQKIKNGTES